MLSDGDIVCQFLNQRNSGSAAMSVESSKLSYVKSKVENNLSSYCRIYARVVLQQESSLKV